MYDAKLRTKTELIDLDRFPSVRSRQSDESVFKWNARIPRNGSGQNGPDHGSELLSSPAPVLQSAGNC